MILFAFGNLYPRVIGPYRLKFSLMDTKMYYFTSLHTSYAARALISMDGENTSDSPVITPLRPCLQVFSDIFTVYTPKKFPGMLRMAHFLRLRRTNLLVASTELTRRLIMSGVRLPTRLRSRRHSNTDLHEDGTGEAPSYDPLEDEEN